MLDIKSYSIIYQFFYFTQLGHFITESYLAIQRGIYKNNFPLIHFSLKIINLWLSQVSNDFDNIIQHSVACVFSFFKFYKFS
jgi:hypothetical protein